VVQDELLEEIYDGEYSPQSRQLVSAFKANQDFTFNDKVEPENLQSSAEIEYTKDLAEKALEECSWDIMTALGPEDRTAGVHVYDALSYDVVEQLQDEIDREFEILVRLPNQVRFQVQNSDSNELMKLTLEKIEEDLVEADVGPKAEIDGGVITRSYSGQPSLEIHVEDYTDEVEEVLSIFNLSS